MSHAPKRYTIKVRAYFSFSDIRYAMAHSIAQKEFFMLSNKKRNPTKNEFIAALLKLAACLKTVKL